MEYAIDFGTSNTVVARVNADGLVETIKLPSLSALIADNPPLIPSLVYVQNANVPEVLIGQEVIDRGFDLANDQRFFRGFKRAIGNPAPGFVPELDQIAVKFELVGSWFLQRLISQLPEVDSLIFTVPVDSFEPYRQWLGSICEKLDVRQVRLLDEPTAAALGYGISAGNETILVIDFGGGTLDLALVQLNSTQAAQASPSNNPLGFLLKWGDRTLNQPNPQKTQIAKVIAKVGQNLGGIDIDYWLLDYFHTEQGLPKNSLVTRLAERVKIALSTSETASEVFFDDRTFESYELDLDRVTFNYILRQKDFFTRLDRVLDQIRQQATRQGVELSDLDAVVLVGGTAQIPAVRDWVEQNFPAEKIKASKPFESIAHGALSQGWQLKDFLYHSYGLRYWDKKYQRHGWHPIIKSGQPYPSAEPVELFLGASAPNQPSIELTIGELSETNVEVYFEDDRLVTRRIDKQQVAVQALNEKATTLAQLNPLGSPGIDRIKVIFRVDEQRTLRITVEDLLIDRTLLENQAVVQLI